MTSQKAQEIFQLLKKHYPHAKMILEWENNFELLVSIILSAQCTDKKVNEVTSVVFPKYRKKRESFDNHYQNYTRIDLPKEQVFELVNFAFVPLSELEQDIKSTGFYHNKAKSVQAAAKTVLDTYHGILPQTIPEMIKIPGVGRKTANVFLGNAYHISEGIAVDTHVKKQAQLLGFTSNSDPDKIEQDLMKLFPKEDWFALTYLLIEHGRNMRRKKSDRHMCGNPTCLLGDTQ
ncbi:MAG TPA: endonuclease III [Patescibacteria group bacterium]|nr:endonuclease III [Patescibacteria group bacterium]